MAQAPAEAPQPEKSSNGAGGGGRARAATHGGFWTLLIGSIGVVYGDIGTSPLYALRECLRIVTNDYETVPTRAEVVGIVSLIFWALIIVVTIKSVFVLLRLDNKGEGGTLSLMALVRKAFAKPSVFLLGAGMLGASLFYADALITPAISVISSVEGLRAVPGVEGYINPWILPISIVILIGLFFVQSRGTATIGALFGPITASVVPRHGRRLACCTSLTTPALSKRCRRCPRLLSSSAIPGFRSLYWARCFSPSPAPRRFTRTWVTSGASRSAARGFSLFCRA